MKILKRGKVPVPPRWHVTCPKCKSELEVVQADIKYDQREGSWVSCPVCSNCITMDGVKPIGED